MSRVLAAASVDADGSERWRVKVWGAPPHDWERHYALVAKTDSLAAQEGIRRFVEEAESLQPS